MFAIVIFFWVVNMYIDHLKFCDVCINGQRYVCCSECYVVSNECDEPAPVLYDLSVVKLRFPLLR